jgi:hypothetical protein
VRHRRHPHQASNRKTPGHGHAKVRYGLIRYLC